MISQFTFLSGAIWHRRDAFFPVTAMALISGYRLNWTVYSWTHQDLWSF